MGEGALESVLESRLFEAVRKAGGLAYKIAPTTAGLPDRMIIIGGQIYLVELKRKGERLRPLQRFIHEKILRRGVQVSVLHGEAEIDAWVEFRR